MKKNVLKTLSLLFSALFVLSLGLTSCSSHKNEYATFSYSALGTDITLSLARRGADGNYLSEDYLSSVAGECAAAISDVESMLSSSVESSDVYAFNSAVDFMISANPAFLSAIENAEKIRALTNGAYDYTLGTVLELWDFKNGTAPSKQSVLNALNHTGYDKFITVNDKILKHDDKLKLNFDGMLAGIAVQAALEHLSETDVVYGLISVGTTVGVYGQNASHGDFKIAIPSPDSSEILGAVYVKSGFVSVASVNDKAFTADDKDYHGIIDPTTGYSADAGLSSVTVIASNGASADALADALFILGLDKSLALYESGTIQFEAIFVTSDGTVYTTNGISQEMFELKSESYSIASDSEN